MMRFRSKEEIEAEADKLRKRLGLSDDPCPDLMTVIVKLKRLIPDFNYKRVPNDALPDADGMYDSARKLLLIPERVFAAMNRWQPRARFSIMHELAHVVLDHTGIRYRHEQLHAYEKAKAGIRREETEANQFAACFLAPAHLATGCATAEELQSRFLLSRSMAGIRLAEVEAHERKKSGAQRPLPDSVVKFLEDAQKKGLR